MTYLPDPPVEMPQDYPCKYERSCEDCSERGTPACPLVEECNDCMTSECDPECEYYGGE